MSATEIMASEEYKILKQHTLRALHYLGPKERRTFLNRYLQDMERYAPGSGEIQERLQRVDRLVCMELLAGVSF
jgi:hypothetical protein